MFRRFPNFHHYVKHWNFPDLRNGGIYEKMLLAERVSVIYYNLKPFLYKIVERTVHGDEKTRIEWFRNPSNYYPPLEHPTYLEFCEFYKIIPVEIN